MQRLRLKGKTRDTITVEWDAIDDTEGLGIHYEVERARGQGMFRSIYKGQQTE